jgi:hypothetical protein
MYISVKRLHIKRVTFNFEKSSGILASVSAILKLFMALAISAENAKKIMVTYQLGDGTSCAAA